MNSIYVYDLFILICNEIKIHKLPKLELISAYHKNIIQNYEWTNTTLLVKNELFLQHILKNYNFRNLQIIFNVNSYMDQLKNCHTLMLEAMINTENIPKLKGCHTVHFANSITPVEILQKLKYCNTIRTYSVAITDKCLKKLRNCYKLEFRSPKLFYQLMCEGINVNFDDEIFFFMPMITNKGIKYIKNCHTLYLNVPHVTNKGISKLKNCHTLYLNSWFITNECIKKLKKCYKIYLFTQYKTHNHIEMSQNHNVENL